jgi:hypothetical protein
LRGRHDRPPASLQSATRRSRRNHGLQSSDNQRRNASSMMRSSLSSQCPILDVIDARGTETILFTMAWDICVSPVRFSRRKRNAEHRRIDALGGNGTNGDARVDLIEEIRCTISAGRGLPVYAPFAATTTIVPRVTSNPARRPQPRRSREFLSPSEAFAREETDGALLQRVDPRRFHSAARSPGST